MDTRPFSVLVPCDIDIPKTCSLEQDFHLLGGGVGGDSISVIEVETAINFVSLNQRNHLQADDTGIESVRQASQMGAFWILDLRSLKPGG